MQRELIVDMSQRIEILELSQLDQAKKWGMFLSDINGTTGRTIMQEQEKESVRKNIDTLFSKVQEIEIRSIGTINMQSLRNNDSIGFNHHE